MRGRVLEGLWFGSCKFIPIICLQLRPVCTVCLQSGAINVIVRGCSWLKRLSYFSLPGFKWALAGFFSQCFSFPNVNASLDLYQPLYTLPFISFSFFLDQIQTERAPFQSGTSAQIYVRSVVRKSVHIHVKSHRTQKNDGFLSCQCFSRSHVQLVEWKKFLNVLLHLKIWTLLVHLFDLIRALQEKLFLLIGGVYLLRGHNIPYYWYCQCVCHSTTITSFMGLGKHGIAYF